MPYFDDHMEPEGDTPRAPTLRRPAHAMGRRLDDSDDSDDLVRTAIKRVCARSCGVVGGQNDAACRLADICYELHVSGVPAGMQHVSQEDVTHEIDARRLQDGALAPMSGPATDAHPENAADAPPLDASRSAEDDMRDRQREEWGFLDSEDRALDAHCGPGCRSRPHKEGGWPCPSEPLWRGSRNDPYCCEADTWLGWDSDEARDCPMHQ